MWIIGIAGSHNGGVALVRNGKVVAAVQAERTVRVKRHLIRLDLIGSDVQQLVQYCLDEAGIGPEAIDVIATSSPWVAAFPRLRSPADWFGTTEDCLPPFVTVPHHLAHAEYALHYSPLEPALVLVLDGSGTRELQRAQLDLKELEHGPIKHLDGIAKESISAYLFDGLKLSLVYRFAGDVANIAIPGVEGRPFLHSVGHLWRWASHYCCGDMNEAGKVMGLASYGDPRRLCGLRYLDFDDRSGAVQISFEQLARLTKPNIARRDITGDAHYEDIAAHIQATTGDFLVRLVRLLDARYSVRHLCYTGGVALNGIANEQMIRATGHRVHMNGSCEDNGTAIGAALAVYHQFTGCRVAERVAEHYGRTYSEEEVVRALTARCIPSRRRARHEVIESAARSLASGGVVAWFQGRSEFGPRALGNRSILADPRDPSIRDRLNVKIKMRERYRPYAPAVLEERAHEFFDLKGASPSMLRVVPVKSGSLPGITHVDGSARVQTVSRRDNPMFYDLIQAFGQITGTPVLLNTSFNRAGEPIIESPQEAVDAFLTMKIDTLIIHDHVITRQDVLSIRDPSPVAAGPKDVRAEDRFVVPHHLRYRVCTAYDGAERDIVRLYGLHSTVALKIGALPLLEVLCGRQRFVAGEMEDWAASGRRYAWEDLRRLLVHLLKCGLITREPDGVAAGCCEAVNRSQTEVSGHSETVLNSWIGTRSD
jgi:carbamoyltransferase